MRIVTGINDLKTIDSKLTEEWHPTKNGDLQPEEVGAFSRKEVWWLGKCGHEWKAKIYSRHNGRQCPVCAGRQVLTGYNDLETVSKELAREWVVELNDNKLPKEVLAGSHKSAYWRCSVCENIWPAEIRSRVKGNGCPECAKKEMSKKIRAASTRKNSLAQNYPDLLKEWDYEKNNIFPNEISSKSSEKVWWKCSKCQYEWPAIISNRTNGSGCPVCSLQVVRIGTNDLLSQNPTLAEEWNYEKNKTLKPQDVTYKSGKKVWWKCRLNHEWPATVYDRVTKNVGCPECKKYYQTSFPEECIFYYMSKIQKDTIHSYKFKDYKNKELDVYIPSLKIGIEYDGQRYHNIEKDKEKDLICKEKNIVLIRVREPNCDKYDRDMPTIILKDLSIQVLEEAILSILKIIGKSYDINLTRDRNDILSQFHDSSVNGSISEEYPRLAEEWSENNGKLSPCNIPATASKKKYLWKCLKCNYEWPASLSERIKGSGCPACAGKKLVEGINDLATTHNEIAEEWHPSKNGKLRPQDFSYGSQEDVWWLCKKCNHEWHTRINRRVNGYGCPECAKNKRKKIVLQYNGDKLIGEYESLKVASQMTGVSSAAICTGCKEGKSVKGFYWKYK